VTTLGNAQKIIHPEGVAEILSRSRKVQTRIPNKTKMVAVCKDWLTARSGRAQGPGQKAHGQRMAGSGPDWPALPELGRAQT